VKSSVTTAKEGATRITHRGFISWVCLYGVVVAGGSVHRAVANRDRQCRRRFLREPITTRTGPRYVKFGGIIPRYENAMRRYQRPGRTPGTRDDDENTILARHRVRGHLELDSFGFTPEISPWGVSGVDRSICRVSRDFVRF